MSNTSYVLNSIPIDGSFNTAIGVGSFNLTSKGYYNTSVGNNALNANTTGQKNNAVGAFALNKNTTGQQNNALGDSALNTNISGNYNNALGGGALNLNTTGENNNAVGYQALRKNTIGVNNNAVGFQALLQNTTGQQNNAVGYQALQLNATGTDNNAFGCNALQQNTASYINAFGSAALQNNTTGTDNNAFGSYALYINDNGNQNNAFGNSALNQNLTGSNNNAFGYSALSNNTNGSDNCAFGVSAIRNNKIGDKNSAIGSQSGTNFINGDNNTFLGANTSVQNSSTYYSNSTAVGYGAIITDSNQMVLGGPETQNINIPNGRLNIGSNGMYIDNGGIHFPDGTYLSTASNTTPPVCYLKGTLILSKRGYIPIEELKIGDEIVTKGLIHKNYLLEDDTPYKINKIIWASKFKCKRLDEESRPICFAKDCFKKNYPFKDLHVSPDHSIMINGKMVSARRLINHKTIYQNKDLNDVIYYHLELDSHRVIYANGVLTESYLDIGNRHVFEPMRRVNNMEPPKQMKRYFSQLVKQHTMY